MRRHTLQKTTASYISNSGFKKPYTTTAHNTRPHIIRAGACAQGESGRKYRLLSPLFEKVSNNASNVWKAVDNHDASLQFVVKAPSHHDCASLDWPRFQHEVQMQRRFSSSPFIRQMTDFIPQSDSTPTMMVLQAFEESLWDARNTRAMTMDEIKWMMKAVLIGLWTIHREGLVYADLKMENVLLNGFKDADPGNVHSIIARLADCGAITMPSNRKITSITYRSPEVYFNRPWSSSNDIWSWGIVYCHLLEARVDMSSPGMYDSICKGTIEEKARAVRNAIATDFSLRFIQFYAGDPESHKLLPVSQVPQREDDWWGEMLLRKGVPVEDVEFLVQVLNPDPNERLSAEDIIRSGYLDVQKET